MSKRNSIQTSEELVLAFADLFDELEPETPEEVASVLRDTGHAPDEVGARMKAVAEQALAKSPLNWRIRAQRELQAEREHLAGLAAPALRNRAEIIAAIKRLVAQSGAQMAYAHRNLESETDEDLASLLADLEYLASQQSGQGD
jgi:hypothetical protein